MVICTRLILLMVMRSILAEGLDYFPPERYLRKDYSHIDPRYKCRGVTKSEICLDIRVCTRAAATLALGEMPTLCGWVGKGVPKVCCGPKLVKGAKLIKKIEAEKARLRECGTTKLSPELSPTEKRFEMLVKTMPAVNVTDPNKFDPPLDLEPYDDGFLIGGKNVRQGDFPWMVTIQKYEEHWCGGSLIDRVHILTAAHCFDDERDPSKYMVLVGNIFVDRGYPIGVSKIVVHPEYSNEYHYHDLAILTLAEEILVPQIPHICLPDPEMSDLAGQNTSLLGWGATSYMGEGTINLQIVDDLPVVPWQECRKTYGKIDADTLPVGITEDFLCAGLREGGKDACQQDSGGPLMYQRKLNQSESAESRWTLVGVVSFGFRCGLPGYPGVYVRVSNYMPWILENMNYG